MTTEASPTSTVPVRCAMATLHSCQRAHASRHSSCKQCNGACSVNCSGGDSCSKRTQACLPSQPAACRLPAPSQPALPSSTHQQLFGGHGHIGLILQLLCRFALEAVACDACERRYRARAIVRDRRHQRIGGQGRWRDEREARALSQFHGFLVTHGCKIRRREGCGGSGQKTRRVLSAREVSLRPAVGRINPPDCDASCRWRP